MSKAKVTRGVVTALKPVRAERVTNKHCDPTNPRLTLTEKNQPSEIEETGPGWAKAARDQTSAAQSINTRRLCIFMLFLFVFGRIFQIYFFIFWPKRPSTRARSVVPLTTPLKVTIRYFYIIPKTVCATPIVNYDGIWNKIHPKPIKSLKSLIDPRSRLNCQSWATNSVSGSLSQKNRIWGSISAAYVNFWG